MNSHNANIRQQVRKLRSELDTVELTGSANKITQQITASSLYHNAQNIAAYIAIHNEVDTYGIIETAWLDNKKIHLPIIQDDSRILQFAQYTPDSKMRRNRYGIPEPMDADNNLITAKNMDLIIVPLVAFNNHCHRLGMGAGYYDHTLATIHATDCISVGIAYPFQYQEDFDVQPWDVALNFVITGCKIYTNPDNPTDTL